ncbi:MAG TPA: hypothetical protein ENN32_05300, partial [Chloroflexi bacterium]|nr:hypothetical protein [Chloroflexota bacterium]
MDKENKQGNLLVSLNLGMTALILLGVIILAGWVLMLDRQINHLNSLAANMMNQQKTLAARADLSQQELAQLQQEIDNLPTQALLANQAEPELPTPTPTTAEENTPTSTVVESELNDDHFDQIILQPQAELYELSDKRYFRLPPLSINLPDGWDFVYESNGNLTFFDPFNNVIEVQLWAVNTIDTFLLNEYGSFDLLSNGDLVWFPDPVPFRGMIADEYSLFFTADDFSSEPLSLILEDAPMSRILQGSYMYRTTADISDSRHYLSFDSQQEPMPIFGYAVNRNGVLYVRTWREYD